MTFERALFLALTAASAATFVWRIRRVFRAIAGSRADASFAWRPIVPRLRRFAVEVLFQARVIRNRPWPGIAHALVFWGFCAFALVTLNHFAAGIGLEFFDARHSAYGAVAFVFSILVTIAMVGLAVRRFIVRPRWLGEHVSLESGVIAALIITLMLTYAAGYLNAPAPRTLWWAHTLALLIFLPLIVRTKHLHLLLSPVAVLARNPVFGQIPPLAGDDDFGLDTGKDLTWRNALQAYACVECGRCQQHCPANATGKALNPKQIVLDLRGYLNDHGARAAAPLPGVDMAFECTTCGACEQQCPVGVEHVGLITGLRRGAVNTGRWEDPRTAALFVKLERQGNPLGMAAFERDRFIKRAALPLFDGTQDYCLWLGCMGAYDPQGRETVTALARILTHLGITFGVLKKEKCTGDAARRLGNDLIFQQLAGFNIAQMRQAGVTRLLSICPHCVRTIGEDWRECGAGFEIEHYTTLLARHAARLPRPAEPVVYHDPCYLGRYSHVYDEPRALINTLDPPRARERAFCCGAGGGQVFLGEEHGTRVSHNRARELAAVAPAVATACPFCQTMLGDALAAVAPQTRLTGIAQLIAARLD